MCIRDSVCVIMCIFVRVFVCARTIVVQACMPVCVRACVRVLVCLCLNQDEVRGKGGQLVKYNTLTDCHTLHFRMGERRTALYKSSQEEEARKWPARLHNI